MFLFIFFGILIITYIVTFKDDFNPEHLDKAGIFIFAISALFILLGILGSLVRRA